MHIRHTKFSNKNPKFCDITILLQCFENQTSDKHIYIQYTHDPNSAVPYRRETFSC